MTQPADATVVDNAAFAKAAPRLSVLTPFFRYDPRPLMDLLDREAEELDGAVELILLDDGGGDIALASCVAEHLKTLTLPARLVALHANQGRSRGRNRLFQEARAAHGLFLDCDMAPDTDSFLADWLALVEAEQPAAAFGGFSLKQIAPSARHDLHHALQTRGECISAAVRARTPEKYVYTSNLLVRRDVFEAEGFDERFTGWGWEDVEWGMRVAARFGVTHIDNTATHLGLDTSEALLNKYEQSLSNFQRILQLHPDIVRGYPSYRLSRALKVLPARKVWRGALKQLALSGAPLPLRVAAAKVFRAGLYAEAEG